MLGIGPMHVVGLLGGPFVRSLAVASAALVACLALLAVVGLLAAIVAPMGDCCGLRNCLFLQLGDADAGDKGARIISTSTPLSSC
jgi:hypothetical protein